MKRLWQAITALSPFGIAVVVVLDILAGTFLRFSASSKLWLDEALGVNIASAPFGQIVGHLRNDGAPPLYYVLLHFWISFFGGSDFAVRSLSGVFSVLGLGTGFILARRLWGIRAALVATGVLAVLPYAVYFGTEARMYSLVMLESALLLFVWIGDWEGSARFRGPVIALLVAMLLYTHYWSIYLVVMLSFTVVVQAWRQRTLSREVKLKAFSILGGGVLWLPWLPIFNQQRLHTGTPWSPPPAVFQFLDWIEGFIVNQGRQHTTPSLHHEISLLLFIAILLLGGFGVAMQDRLVATLELRVPQPVKFLMGIILGTMLLGLLASHFGHTTFVPRYAAVIAIPLALVSARGMMVLDKPIRIFLVLVLFSAAALWTDKWGRNVQRSQAGQVAAVLAMAKPDSYVFMCPDQLGPTVLRYSRSDLEYSAYPRFENPKFVDWYDYKAAFGATSPAAAASRVLAAAGGRDIYVIWSSGYTLKGTCKLVAHEISTATGRVSANLLRARVNGFYQSINVTFLPHN